MPQSPQDITVTDLLGRPPGWLLRSGISMTFAVVLLGLILTAFISYPDRLTGTLQLQYERPPVMLSPPSNTPIAQLFVVDGDSVQKGQPLVLFHSDTDWEEVQYIERIANSPLEMLESLPEFRRLGSLQNSWSAWVDARSALQHFEQHSSFQEQLLNLYQEQEYHRQLMEILRQRIAISDRQLMLETTDYKRQQDLAGDGVISVQDLEKKEKIWLDLKSRYRTQEAELVQLEMQINSLAKQILNLTSEHENTTFNLQQALDQAKAHLLGSIRKWRTAFLLVAPIAGEVQLPADVIAGQVVQPNSPVLTILPFIGKETQLLAQICLPLQGSGKIALQDRILLQIDAYPEVEYGTLTTHVAHIAALPESHDTEQACQLITAILPRPLLTDYGKILAPTPHMAGSATVITAERSLLGRIFQQFRQLLKVSNE